MPLELFLFVPFVSKAVLCEYCLGISVGHSWDEYDCKSEIFCLGKVCMICEVQLEIVFMCIHLLGLHECMLK